MAFVPLHPTPLQFFDEDGDPLTAAVLSFFLAGSTTPTTLYSDSSGSSIGTSITLNSSGYPESGSNIITLFRDSDVALKLILFPNAVAAAALTNAIWAADELEDGLVLLSSIVNGKGASLIGVEDSGLFFADANVEAILADIGEFFLRTTRADEISAVMTHIAAIQMSDNELRKAKLLDYAIVHNVVTSSSGIADLDLTTGNSFAITLSEETTITLSNPPATGILGEIRIKVIQDGAGGSYNITWPSSVKWPSATAPTITTSNDAVDRITLETDDAGTTWLGGFAKAHA